VTYVGTDAVCAIYRVRIDLKQERVLATRLAKEGVTSPMCSAMEKRVEMHLADGVRHLVDDHSWRDKLNLPLLNIFWTRH